MTERRDDDRAGGDRYQLGDELGAGGMATVYKARDRELRRDVAVKVLFPHLAKKPELTRRFQREARAAAGLEHENILRVYDVGGGAAPYIVMELVRGGSLRERTDGGGPLLAELVAAIGALLCDALAVAHAAGVIHRDVKPANVMIADDGRLLLADFGVARIDDDDSLHTRTGALLGTPSFMAPEQAHGDAIDARADLYAVGVTLYQLATGGLPFSGPTAKIVADAQKGAPPALRRQPAVGAPLSRLIARLMEPDASKRPPDAATAARELRALVTAGGLGSAKDEVRAWALDGDGYRAARLPRVEAALLADATAAAEQGATARALATCDRLLALAPDHAGATALVARVTRRGQHRRVLIAGAAAVALGGAAIGGWRMLAHGSATPPPVDAAAIDGGVIDGGAIDGNAIDASAIDADAIAIDAGARDAALARRDAATTTSLAIDARPLDAAPPIDAAPASLAIDAAPAPGTIVLAVDSWCDLTIDGHARGRASAAPIELAPGTHTLLCKQGLGQGAWTDTVTVVSGQTRTLDVTLLPSVILTNGLSDSIRVRDRTLAPGAVMTLRPGRVRVELVRDQGTTALGWMSVPQVARCTVRTQPELACYP